jgi:internalin A
MKRLLYIFLFFYSSSVAGQTVPVPDPNFLAFLKSNFPATINASNQLIISQAAAVTGTIDFSNSGINDATGIQYFTGINTIYATGNNLVAFPDISGLVNLKYLHINSNYLTSLPSLNNLTNLLYLICSNNQITLIPNLTNNTLLKQLIVFNNKLTSLPSLNTLSDLRKIDLGGNNITSLPDLSNQTLLEELLFSGNKIDSIPPLNIYPNLFRLNAGINKIGKVPDLSTNKRLKILSLNDNLLTVGPNISGLDSLTTVELYNNNLSFSDLIPYLSYPSYSSVFSVSPQNNFPGGTILVNAGDTLIIPGIDAGLSAVSYKWYFNTSLTANTSDTFKIYPFTSANEGKYTSSSTDPSFPGLVIKTDTFIVSSTSATCLDITGMSFVVDGINCLKAGNLKVNWAPLPTQAVTYSLQGSQTGKTYSSASGSFSGLTESDYILYIIAGPSCQKSYPVHVPVEECTETFITPDKDGDKDSFFFSASGKAVIYDKNGTVVKTLSIPAEWDGSSKLGKLVTQGYYVADINDGQEYIKISVIY